MWWNDLQGALDAFAVPALIASVVGVYVHHVYTDRARRQDFRRNALYERKLGAYQAIVSTARGVADLFGWIMRWQDAQKFAEANVGDMPQERRAEAVKVLATLLSRMREKQFEGILKRTGWEADVLAPPTHGSGLLDGTDIDAVRLFFDFLSLAMNAEHDLQAAATNLKLLGCPRNIVERVDSLMDQIMEKSPSAASSKGLTSSDVDDFEESVKDHIGRLVGAMNADLEATMVGSG